jgi:DNA processing protein
VIPEDGGTWPAAAVTVLDQTGSDTDQPSSAPLALWIRSDLGIAELPQLLTDNVALVGARAASGYGEHVAAQFGYDLAMQGISVASGAGYGVEGAGLRGALTYGTGRTVAVLGAGVDQNYPHGHHGLLTSVAAQGAVISEYPPGAPPARARFLASRRVLAAISSVLVVVEAGARSGNQATARIARTLGRTVMAVPGPITSATSRGTNQMLHDMAAIAVTSIHDVLDAHRETALAAITPDPARSEPPVRVVATRMPITSPAAAGDVVDGELVD